MKFLKNCAACQKRSGLPPLQDKIGVFSAYAHFYASCTLVCAHIFMKSFIVGHCHLMTLRIKFHKHTTISWGDIPLFVTLYNFGSHSQKKTKISDLGHLEYVFTYSLNATFPWTTTKGFRQFGEKIIPVEAPFWTWFGDIWLIGMYFWVIPAIYQFPWWYKRLFSLY